MWVSATALSIQVVVIFKNWYSLKSWISQTPTTFWFVFLYDRASSSKYDWSRYSKEIALPFIWLISKWRVENMWCLNSVFMIDQVKTASPTYSLVLSHKKGFEQYIDSMLYATITISYPSLQGSSWMFFARLRQYLSAKIFCLSAGLEIRACQPSLTSQN